MNDNQIRNFIQQRLSLQLKNFPTLNNVSIDIIENDYIRFDMLGSLEGKKHNAMLLSNFSDLNLYDNTEYFLLEFNNGCGKIHLKYFDRIKKKEIDLKGLDTIEIIQQIFKYTIFSKRPRRK